MGKNFFIFTSLVTLTQAVYQVIFTSVSIAQYFCVIDFLRELPNLLFIKILYLHNTSSCGSRITIGHAIDGISNQAFVLLSSEPFTAIRTFYINCISLGLNTLWTIACCVMLVRGTNEDFSRPIRWPWITMSVAVSILDLIATLTFANDHFHTRTLGDIMGYIGGTANGIGSNNINTVAAAWIMVLVYSRLGIFCGLNVVLVILVATNKYGLKKSNADTVEAPISQMLAAPLEPTVTPTLQEPIHYEIRSLNESQADQESVASNIGVAGTLTKANRNKSTLACSSQKNKNILETYDFDEDSVDADKLPASSEVKNVDVSTFDVPRSFSNKTFHRMERIDIVPNAPKRHSIVRATSKISPQLIDPSVTKAKHVHFPENLLSLPQRIEKIIVKQQQCLDCPKIDTSESKDEPEPGPSGTNPIFNKGRRDTAAELQGQLPWSYVPAPSRMRHQSLHSDEALPPVPLPDYTAIQTFRKSSVHRATSDMSLPTKKVNMNKKSRITLFSAPDVMY